MTTGIIITICILLLIAYLFDVTSILTKIPPVILLLLVGWMARQTTRVFNVHLPDFSAILPIFGTIGLILIVLEGSLELELNKSKIGLIKKSFFGALFSIIALAVTLGYLFHYFGNYPLKLSLINAVPLCVISSAIAIPTVRYLATADKEFVIYESSLSDIMGVLLFNFVSLNKNFGATSFGNFGLQILTITIVSFVATIGLSLLLNKIEHHIKFIPIILLVILIYSVSKIYHLPGLIFILIFGLFLGNLDELKRFPWINKFRPAELDKEVKKFKELIIEGTFLVRSLFFLLFGYLIETAELLNTKTLIWSAGIVAAIFIFRALQLKVSKLPLTPLLFIAPRGLITILLFLSIHPGQNIDLVNKSLITQVIVLSALLMMVGLLATKKEIKITGQ